MFYTLCSLNVFYQISKSKYAIKILVFYYQAPRTNAGAIDQNSGMWSAGCRLMNKKHRNGTQINTLSPCLVTRLGTFTFEVLVQQWPIPQ